ncbi:hypothetical protein D3C85_1007100 [compost metagenome]
MTPRQGIWVENGQYGKNLTAMRTTAGEFLKALEHKAGINFVAGSAIRVRRELLGFSMDEFYDAMRIKPDRAKKIEDGRCDEVTTELRALVERKLIALESDPFFFKPRFIQPKQEGKTLPAARFLIVTEDGRSVTKAGDDIRHRRMGLGVQRDEIPDLTSNQVDNIEVGIYHADWVNFANKIWAYLDRVEVANTLRGPEVYTGADVPADVAQATKEVVTGGVNEVVRSDKKATQKQLEKFADMLGQNLLRNNRDIVTIPWAGFYALLERETGCGQFDLSLLDSIFSNNTVCSVQFMISYGNVVVVICKDSNFAPVVLPE